MNLDTLARAAGDIADTTPADLVAGRQRLDRAIDAEDQRVTAVRRSRRQRRWSVSALAGAAAAAAALLVVPLLTPAPASAEAVLIAAADAAGQQADAAAGAAYWHAVSEVDYPNTEPFQWEIWRARTGQSIVRDEQWAALAAYEAGVTELDPALIRTEGVLMEGSDQAATFVVGGEGLTWQDLEALPTDPGELGALLREKVAGHDSGEDNELWESVTGLLTNSPASPALRRALWQVAATIPDVELIGSATDSIGRHGTAIERNQLDAGWFRVVHIINPTDGTLLETRDIDADGTIVYRWTALEQGPSDTAPKPQPPRCGPGSTSGTSC
jgi:hypothetical protein